jgi:vanadium chloroperoxidase
MLFLPKVEEDSGLNALPVLYWNHVGLEMNRITHSLGGPHTGPTMSSRALGLLHLAMHDAYFTHLTGAAYKPYLAKFKVKDFKPLGWNHATAELAMTGAAVTVLDQLYRFTGSGISRLANETLTSMLSACIRDFPGQIDTLDPAYKFGVDVATQIIAKLGVKPGDIGADQGRYEPKNGRYYFRDEPANPVRHMAIDPDNPERGQKTVRMYHAPFYGSTVAPFATTPGLHRLAPPPKELGYRIPKATAATDAAYKKALKEVIALGGAAGQSKTIRSPDETVQAIYWAYDGANLIGTPPRLYNQIIRAVAWDRKPAEGGDSAAWAAQTTAEMVRLFALVNAAMADAGKYAWHEKYTYEYWRPLTGVREHDKGCGPEIAASSQVLDADADPFWQALGAPETNTHNISFKPPFPAYPSGHATFGAACFQMARLFYKSRDCLKFDDNEPDNICFTFVSDELNGVCRDLYSTYDASLHIDDQPGLVRTRVNRHYTSLWQAIFENAISRIYLGVHWHFDAFDAADVANGADPKTGRVDYKRPENITYSHVWTSGQEDRPELPTGGVPLGLGIANEIWHNDLKELAPALQEVPANAQYDQLLKSSNTSIR